MSVGSGSFSFHFLSISSIIFTFLVQKYLLLPFAPPSLRFFLLLTTPRQREILSNLSSFNMDSRIMIPIVISVLEAASSFRMFLVQSSPFVFLVMPCIVIKQRPLAFPFVPSMILKGLTRIKKKSKSSPSHLMLFLPVMLSSSKFPSFLGLVSTRQANSPLPFRMLIRLPIRFKSFVQQSNSNTKKAHVLALLLEPLKCLRKNLWPML